MWVLYRKYLQGYFSLEYLVVLCYEPPHSRVPLVVLWWYSAGTPKQSTPGGTLYKSTHIAGHWESGCVLQNLHTCTTMYFNLNSPILCNSIFVRTTECPYYYVYVDLNSHRHTCCGTLHILSCSIFSQKTQYFCEDYIMSLLCFSQLS